MYIGNSHLFSGGPVVPSIIFSDTFTEALDTPLASHIPEIGTGWTLVFATGSSQLLKVGASLGMVEVDGGINSSDGSLYSADVTYLSPDYEVEVEIFGNEAGDDVYVLAARIQDSNNMYAVEFARTGVVSAQLYKKVGGTWTPLGASFDSAVNASGGLAKLKIVGSVLSFEADGIEKQSVVDTSIILAGKAGIGVGAVIIPTRDEDNQRFDNFVVTNLG